MSTRIVDFLADATLPPNSWREAWPRLIVVISACFLVVGLDRLFHTGVVAYVLGYAVAHGQLYARRRLLHEDGQSKNGK